MNERLRVERTRCDGYGMCAELLPELVALDDWGYPILRDAPVPERLRDLARRAVDACPVLALRLVAAQPEAHSDRVPAVARGFAGPGARPSGARPSGARPAGPRSASSRPAGSRPAGAPSPWG